MSPDVSRPAGTGPVGRLTSGAGDFRDTPARLTLEGSALPSDGSDQVGEKEGFAMPTSAHTSHANHTHQHRAGCGHVAVPHSDHVDYVHDGHLHRVHEGHTDECEPAGHTVHQDHAHQHRPGCGHVAVPHGDHMDYVHDGHRHAQHDGHWDDH